MSVSQLKQAIRELKSDGGKHRREIDALKKKLEKKLDLRQKLGALKTGQSDLMAGQSNLMIGQSDLKAGQRNISASQNQLKTRQRIISSSQNELKEGQNHISQENKKWFWQKNPAKKPDHLN